jgi:hypothetical protein
MSRADTFAFHPMRSFGNFHRAELNSWLSIRTAAVAQTGSRKVGPWTVHQDLANDGKTLRRSFDNFLDRRAAHMLSAFASDTALLLAHLDCDEKSNEIPAVQTLLGSLALNGAVVTVDAMHCQKKHSSMPLPVMFI